jgi:hypothetical protein
VFFLEPWKVGAAEYDETEEILFVEMAECIWSAQYISSGIRNGEGKD